MSVVSISEAAKLTGKGRRTIQRHIDAGKLSRAQNCQGIDTSELLRVYGAFVVSNDAGDAVSKSAPLAQQTTPYDAPFDTEKEALKVEIQNLKMLLSEKEERIRDKQAHIDSLNQALLLLEHKTNTSTAPAKKSFWSFLKGG